MAGGGKNWGEANARVSASLVLTEIWAPTGRKPICLTSEYFLTWKPQTSSEMRLWEGEVPAEPSYPNRLRAARREARAPRRSCTSKRRSRSSGCVSRSMSSRGEDHLAVVLPSWLPSPGLHRPESDCAEEGRALRVCMGTIAAVAQLCVRRPSKRRGRGEERRRHYSWRDRAAHRAGPCWLAAIYCQIKASLVQLPVSSCPEARSAKFGVPASAGLIRLKAELQTVEFEVVTNLRGAVLS